MSTPAPALPEPELSVLVLTWNRAELVRRCLSSIVGQLGPDDELVIVDNGSTDHTPDVLAGFGRARVVTLPRNLGAAGGRNVGMDAVTGSWVYCVDDDGWLPPGTLDRVRRSTARHPDAAIIAGSCVTDPSLRPADSYPTPAFRFGAGMSVLRRDWFERCGRYPVDGLRQGEERELAFKIYEAGGHVLRDPAMAIVHAPEDSIAHARAVVRNNVRQDLTTTLRYYPVALLAPALISKVARYTRSGLQRHVVDEVPAGVREVWAARQEIWASRRPVSWRTIGASLSFTDRWRRQAAGL